MLPMRIMEREGQIIFLWRWIMALLMLPIRIIRQQNSWKPLGPGGGSMRGAGCISLRVKNGEILVAYADEEQKWRPTVKRYVR